MELDQLKQLDKPTLIAMVTELSHKNNCLEGAIVDITIKNAAFRQRTNETGILFSDFAQRWLTLNKDKWQRTTYEGYRNNVCKHIVPYFFEQKLLLTDLKMTDIQSYYQNKLEEGMSPNTVIKHHNNIRSVLIYAKKEGLIESSPAEYINRPSAERFEATFYQPEEIEQLLVAARGSTIFTPIMLAAFLGLRRSEVLGLKWDAINFNDNTIAIKRKLIRVTENGKDVLYVDEKMKTKTSRRTLSLPKQLADYLRFMKTWQQQGGIKQAKKYDAKYKDFICLNDCGKIISPTNLSNTFSRLIRKNNLRYLRYHDLRHSCASVLYALGSDLKDIQEWLGHSNIGTTANLYIHLDFQRKALVAQKLNQAIKISELDRRICWS